MRRIAKLSRRGHASCRNDPKGLHAVALGRRRPPLAMPRHRVATAS
jgi:hypothetical protein